MAKHHAGDKQERDEFFEEQVENPQNYNQNDLLKLNYEYETEPVIVDREVKTGINGASAKFNPMTNEQPQAGPN